MSTLFIADLHLDEQASETAEVFLTFIKEEAIHADALYILGDLFEIWVGDDYLTPFTLSIIRALKQLTDNGVPVYLMHGNRDFLIGKRFCTLSGCKLLKDPAVIYLYGHRVLLTHGDLLCTNHKTYQKFRKKMRNPLRQKMFLLFPLKKRLEIATRYRTTSKIHTAQTPQDLLKIPQETIEAIMQRYQVHTLIHGHIHQPGIHHFEISSQTFTRIVLGAWDTKGNVLDCSENLDNHELEYQLSAFE